MVDSRVPLVKLIRSVDCLDVLDQEIRWCNDSPHLEVTDEWRDGFIAGLMQAEYLVKQVAQPRANLRSKDYYYKRVTCDICGRGMSENWLVRHRKERHG